MGLKWYHHTLIVTVLVLFTLFFYKDGFGFAPFLLAAVYLAIISYNEFKRLKNGKSS